MFSKISQNSQENTRARVSFLIKLQAEDSDSSTGVFLWILRNFKNTLFYKWPDGSFCILSFEQVKHGIYHINQPSFTLPSSTMETPKQSVKSVQS